MFLRVLCVQHPAKKNILFEMSSLIVIYPGKHFANTSMSC